MLRAHRFSKRLGEKSNFIFTLLLFGSERYNPITGTGIPVNPARANTSAIFGGSPGSIEYMFIPPSATTRPTKPSTTHERKRSTSRESLRRSFPPLSEDQADSTDECSSVSDVSECGSEAGKSFRSRRNSNTSLGKSSRPLTRTTSSRLPRAVAKPRVMKRAHSFTRENTSRPARGPNREMRVTHSASDLSNQAKRPGANGTKIPRKQTSGSQSSRIPLKRADVNLNSAGNGAGKSGAENVAAKQATAEPQASGIPVKATGVQKRFNDDTGAEAGTSSGIPVKSSANRTQLHPGISKIPQSKRDRSQQVNKSSETRDGDEERRKSIDKENDDAETAVQAGEQLSKREGNGDELRVTKPEMTKSKLPQRKSSIPRASSRGAAAQQKMKNNENVGEGSTNEKNKQNVNNESCQSGSKAGTNMEQHGVSRIPVNKRAETKTAGSGTTQRAECGRGVTNSVSKIEKPVVETGNEFSLSRENSRSKIPIMSRKGRASTNAVGKIPNDGEASTVVEVRKRENGKQQESRAQDDGDLQESILMSKHSVCDPKMSLRHEQESGKQAVTSETSRVEQFKKKEQENTSVNGGKEQELDVPTRAEEKLRNDKKVETTTEHFAPEETDMLPERGGLVTRIENTKNLKQDLPISKNNAVTSSTDISDTTDVPFKTNNANSSCDVEAGTGSTDRHENLRSGSHQHKITSSAEKSNDGMKTKIGFKERGDEPKEATSRLIKNLKTEGKKKAVEEIAGNGSTLQGKLEKPSYLELKNENNNNRRGADKEMPVQLGNAGDSSEETSPESSFLDEYLAVSGVEREGEATKKFDNCFECRMEQNEDKDGEFFEVDDDGGENSFRSNVRRYPTFISPRKSIVLCEHHEKLKNERDGELCDLQEPLGQNSQSKFAAIKDERVPAVSPLSNVGASKDLTEPRRQGLNQNDGTTTAKEAVDGGDMLNNTISQVAESKDLAELQQQDLDQNDGTTKVKKTADGGNLLNNLAKTKVKKTPTGGCEDSPNNNVSQITVEPVSKEAVPKKGGSPLLALSRDKKYVSGENLAPSKNAEAIKAALSLEWDDIGTELSPPNFSEDDEEISETGSTKQGQELEDERTPSVKLMNTNEALDKLKMIQSLIMKEAENRSRKESLESAGKRTTDAGTTNASSTLDRHVSGGHRESKELGTIIPEQSFQTSEAPDRGDVSSPTIWDRISDDVTSQHQTTELLNETLAKLKASPQFSGNSLSRRTISSRSLPGSRQASKERLLSDAERPVYVYTSSWMNASGKNSVASSLSLCSANRSLPSSRQNLAKDPLKRSESLSGRIEKDNEKPNEYRERKEFRLSDFDEMLSEDGQQEVNNQLTSNNTTVSPVAEIPGMNLLHEVPSNKAIKMSKRKKKSKNTAETMNNATPYGVSLEDLADGKTTCQCGKKGCVIS